MQNATKLRIGDVLVDLDKLEALSPGERLEARLLLTELERLREVNPLEFYRPNGPKYEAFHLAPHKLKAIQGGNRSGKTTTAIVDDIIQMTPKELLPEHLHAYKHWSCPFYCRVMTPDMERTMKPVIHHKLREWVPQQLLRGGSFDRSYDKQAQCLRLECGCRFDFLSYEMALDKFGGAALHRCHYDEEPPEPIRNECLVRLIDFNGEELFSFTPLKGLTWAYRRIYRNRDDPNIFVTQVSMRDNPNLNAAGIDRVLDSAMGLDEVQRQMRELGLFTAEHGMVYPDVRDWLVPAPDRESVRRHDILVGIDPGITKAGITWTAHEHSERFVTFDARELRGKTVDIYAEEIRRTNARWGLDEDRISYLIDPAARARSLTNAESVESELIRLGIYVEHGQNDVDAGILMLNRLGRQGMWCIADNLREFIEVLEDYSLTTWQDGTVHPEKDGREHMADSVRYAISARAWPEQFDKQRQEVYPEGYAYPPPRRAVPGPGVAGDMV